MSYNFLMVIILISVILGIVGVLACIITMFEDRE